MSDWYFWNPETDELTKAKYDILTDPMELWKPEHLEVMRSREKTLRVAQSKIRGFWISTVFLGLDHSFGGGEPLLFETMMTDPKGRWLSYQDRYPSGKTARAAHEKLDRISRRLLLKAPQISKKNYEDVLRQI